MELRVHDLVRLDALSVADELPAWVRISLQHAPWAVVRRAAPTAGRLALGVRGETRSQRAAIDVPAGALRESASPESLAARALAHARARAHVPACAALAVVDDAAQRCGLKWGPAGSVGFEIASSTAAANERSDCDIVIRADGVERAVLAAFAAAVVAAPARVDAVLEYAFGGVALQEYLAGGSVVVKTAAGPQMRCIP